MNPAGEEVTNSLLVVQLHLFDIDVPGKITFQESKILSPGDSFSTFDTRKYQTRSPVLVVSGEENQVFLPFFLLMSLPHFFIYPDCKTRSETGREWSEI